MDGQEEHLTSIHEAAHAVMSVCYDLPIAAVSIRAEGGGACYGATPLDDIEMVDVSSDERFLLEAHLVTLLAGPIAEARVRGEWNQVGASHDMDVVDDVTRRMCGGEEREAAAYRDWLRLRTERELGALEWRAVEKVAAALRERRTLSPGEVRVVMDPRH